MLSIGHVDSNSIDLRVRLLVHTQILLKVVVVATIFLGLYWGVKNYFSVWILGVERSEVSGMVAVLVAATVGLGVLGWQERRRRIRESSLRASAEQRLQHAVDAAEAANESKSTLLASVSHELRTPLNAIIGFTDVIHTETFGRIKPTRYGDYIDNVRKSAYSLLNTIDDILDISRMESGEYKFELESLPLLALVDDTRHGFASEAQDRDVRVTVDIPEGLFLRADRSALQRIIGNLISNAIKFNRAGGLVEIEANEEGDDTVCLSIRDTGLGMDRHLAARLFEPFAQMTPTYARTAEGLGLGLTIVGRLVALQGGLVNLSSCIGVGTAVTVRLPKGPAVDTPRS